MTPVQSFAALAKTSAVVFLRFRTEAGGLATRADVASVAVVVLDKDGTVTYSATPEKADVVFDTPQTDDLRFQEAGGFNVRLTLPPAAFPSAGSGYRVEVKLTEAGGAVLRAILQGSAGSVLSD